MKYIPTGLQHGTVTVVINDEPYEITTLRTEANHDGRYADMTFTRSIEDDLGRRDLTINAMAMDFHGNIIDPFGGQDDLINRKVRFVGSPDARMAEDYLRILRWLRFHARISPFEALDTDTVSAAMRQAQGLKHISRERIWSEVSKMLTAEVSGEVFTWLRGMGLAPYIDLPSGSAGDVGFARGYTSDPVTLMAVYLRRHDTCVMERLAKTWKWSNAETAQAMAIIKAMDKKRDVDEMKFQVAVNGERLDYMVEAMRASGRPYSVAELENWEVPTFPVTGTDMINAGLTPGKEMGEQLKRMRNIWGRSGFTMTRDQLMATYTPYPADFESADD